VLLSIPTAWTYRRGDGARCASLITTSIKLWTAAGLAPMAAPVTRWMAANVAVAQDPAGNLKPAKERAGCDLLFLNRNEQLLGLAA
jgi:hypothetical protein